ncbi:MAG: glycerophosphodiester phosphodiesterase [candidate division FCPU426 bacterium]
MAPKLIAHRLNRLTALRRALNWRRSIPGLWLECDLRATSDRLIIAQHDPECQGRQVHEWPADALPGSVLTLDDVMRQVRPTGATMHLDVKALRADGGWQAAITASRLLAVLKDHGMARRAVVSALAGGFLRRLRRLDPHLRLGVLCDAAYGEPRPRTRPAVRRLLTKLLAFHWAVKLEAVFLNQAWLRAFDRQWRLAGDFLRILRGAGMRPMVWTVNDPVWARRLMALGADRITTDEPGRLWRTLTRPLATESSQT